MIQGYIRVRYAPRAYHARAVGSATDNELLAPGKAKAMPDGGGAPPDWDHLDHDHYRDS